jgi:hypothetical protein
MRWLRVTEQFSRQENYYRLRMQASEADGLDLNVFLYLGLPLGIGETEQRAEFQGVCSPYDMSDIPAGEPAESADPPWVRHSAVDLLFRSLTDYTEGRSTLIGQLQTLLFVLDELDMVESEADLEFGESESEA